MASANPSHRYLSTRGGSFEFTFEAAVLKGLADDGGLFIPEEIPSLPTDWKSRWDGLSFQDLAVEVMSLYISPEEIPRMDLEGIVQRSYSTFKMADVTPLKSVNFQDDLHILELFHGPTFAFKDVALQFLGNVFEYFLERKNSGKSAADSYKLTVIGATSGDTGSAAIYGLRGKKNIDVFITYPNGKVSPIQEAQMTTVLDRNIHNIAVSGTFDDCQDIVKKIFSDKEFNKKYNLGAINSINWARILAQIVYYVFSYLRVTKQLKDAGKDGGDERIFYVVPTGNFGDVLAGYYAKRMGVPIANLVISTNENDILDRFWKSGKYEIKRVPADEASGGLSEDGAKAHAEGVKETYSPAMDILVSSNFERLLWYLAYEDAFTQGDGDPAKGRVQAGATVKEWMNRFKSTGSLAVPEAVIASARRDFSSERVTDEETLATIKSVYRKAAGAGEPYVLDPHSAVGVTAAIRYSESESAPPPGTHYVCLATAHPAKFSHAVGLALEEEETYSYERIQPPEFKGLSDAEKRIVTVDKADEASVMRVIERLV